VPSRTSGSGRRSGETGWPQGQYRAPGRPHEIETAYLALRHTLPGGYVLRSRDRAGAEQELWALLTVYQLIRMTMTAAAVSVPGADPDRASFTTALQTARDQITAAHGIADSGDPAGIGRIGRAVLDSLLPVRRARYSARKVKCATSRYLNRDGGRPQKTTVITRVEITILVPPPGRPAARSRARKNDSPERNLRSDDAQ
jgi:hypothetical protein